ncbi:hypothetical protein SETIT_5G249300v2 [Setaria italica]|uniref:C2H2-type domain-containing protein n=1 Tax=Setaria italica TaxID=4555 RepID=A0A368R8G4_SETIT|nr:hypothetical protein SETIT_5G249300v2 [Setaria italica]
MAGSSEERLRRPTSRFHADLHDDEPEEGEVVPGYHSDVDTEEYYNRHSYSSDSDETVSDSNAACSVPENYDDATSPYPVAAKYGSAGASSVAANNNNGGNASSSSVAAPVMLPCPVCGKEFSSQKVHQHGVGRQDQGIGKVRGIKRDVVPVVGRWGGNGKRGCLGLGGRAATPNAESDQSMAIVVAEPQIVFQPMPLAFAAPNLSSVSIASASPNPSSVPTASAMATPNPSSSSMASTSPNLSPVPLASSMTNVSDQSMTNVSDQSSSAQPMNNDAMDTVVAGADNPRSDVDAHAATPSTPPAAGEQAPSVHQQPMAPPSPPAAVERAPPAHQPPIVPRPAAGRQNPNGYTCNECDAWFRTHQGLGGHRAGHKNRELVAVAAEMLGDGAVPGRRNAKPEKTHACKVCGVVFPAGVQLGGHMRKHYAGPPIVPNKKPRLVIQPLLPPPALTLVLPANVYADEASPAPALEAAVQPGPAPAVERTPEPAPGPAVVGRVLLFGIDIGVGVKKPAAHEDPSATEGSASTDGEQ